MIVVIVLGGGFSNHPMAISNFAIIICMGPSKVGDTLHVRTSLMRNCSWMTAAPLSC